MIEAMLEPFLIHHANATIPQVGAVFLTFALVYMAASPVAGYVCDRVEQPVYVSLLGNLANVVAFTFIGPIPIIPWKPDLKRVFGMVGLVGLGYATVMVSSFARAQKAAQDLGYQDDIRTYLMISGIWSASFYFGSFLGPTVSGILVEQLGFQMVTFIFVILYCINILIDLMDLCCNKFSSQRIDYENI